MTSQNASQPPSEDLARPPVRLDVRWTGANLAAMLALAGLAAGAMALQSAGRRELAASPAVDAARVKAAAEKVNPNTAPYASLRRLPQMGPARAALILDYRQAHAAPGAPPPFRDASDLERIRGIGPGIVQALREYLDFSSPGG